MCRDTAGFPHECIYCQLIVADASDDDDDVGGDDDEIRFVPADPGALHVIYRAMSECQTLHPSPAENEGDGESAAAASGLMLHLESLLDASGAETPPAAATAPAPLPGQFAPATDP